jgi:MoaA/NifB/PqqE/SkfB family radical SAM enzyme
MSSNLAVNQYGTSRAGDKAAGLPRVAIIVSYDCEETFQALERRIASPSYRTELYAVPGKRLDGAPGSRSVPRDPAAWLVRNRRAYEYAVFLHHPFVGLAEIEEAIARLSSGDTPIYYLIPGLNDLLTLGFAALVAYDLTKPSLKLKVQPIGERVRRTLAPHLPVPVKQVIKDGLASLGLLSQFGSPLPGAPTVLQTQDSVAADGAVRISTQKSVAGVMERQNPRNLPYIYSLGSRALQKRFFVDDVVRHFPLPRAISLVLSNQCNLKCVMCPYHSPLFTQNRKNDYFDDKRWMPVALVERLADELKDNDEPITFHMGELDEPMLHPDLPAIVRMLAAVPHSTVHITSNGNLLSEKLGRELIDAGIKSLQFSVDAQTQETYKKIRGAKLEKVQRNVERFLRLREELRPDLYVNLCIINQEGASDEIEDFKAYWREKGASSVSVYQLFKPAEGDGAHWVVPNKYYEEKKRTPCTALWDQCFVYPEGEVSLCCTTLVRVPQEGVISKGNLKERSLREIWSGALYQKVRADLIDERLDDHKYCAECDNWSSSYQYKKTLEDGTEFVYGESMGYYFFPEHKPK